nr:B3 domain-containing protein At1g05920-like [Ipomoea batatas]
MVCLKDFAEITLPAGSCRFDYLLAVCKRERLLLEKEEQKDEQQKKGRCYNDDDEYYLGGVDLNQSLIKPTDKEEWRKKLMGLFYGLLSWQNNVAVKPVVKSTARSNTPQFVISHSSGSDDDRASLKYDEAVAEKVNNSKKRKRGSSRMPNNGPEPPPGLPVEFRNLILQLAGNRAVCVEKLVIQKELTETDVNSTQNRLSIPARLVREEFLTGEENRLLCQRNRKNVCSIEVPLITPMMEVAKIAALEDARKQVVEDTVELLKFFHEINRVVMLQSCFGFILVNVLSCSLGGEIAKWQYNALMLWKFCSSKMLTSLEDAVVVTWAMAAEAPSQQPRQHLQALLLPSPQCPLRSLFSLISYHWPVPAVLNSPNELHSVSLSQDLPSEVSPSVVEQLQKWVLMAEAIIEQNKKETAALKEQVKQFESR